MSARLAVKAAQRLLHDAHDRSLIVDGTWGPKSEKAYASAPIAVQLAVLRAVKDVGYDFFEVTRPAAHMTRSEAVKTAQVQLSVNEEIQTDGVWGPVTQAAYLKASPMVRDLVDSTAEKNGLRVAERRASPPAVSPLVRVAAAKAANAPGFISVADAVKLAESAEQEFKLPKGTMILMLRQEAPRVPGGYDAGARGGAGNRYLGLYQLFDREVNSSGAAYAWGMAKASARKLGLSLSSISNWMDARENTRAAAAYASFHQRELAKTGATVTPAMLYYAHQQGLGTVQAALASGKANIVGKQSKESVSVINSIFA